MKLIFTRDVLKEDGSIKFKRGEIRDFGKGTWQQIAASAGMRRFEDFTMTETAAAVAGVMAGTAPATDSSTGRKAHADKPASGRRRIAA